MKPKYKIGQAVKSVIDEEDDWKIVDIFISPSTKKVVYKIKAPLYNWYDYVDGKVLKLKK